MWIQLNKIYGIMSERKTYSKLEHIFSNIWAKRTTEINTNEIDVLEFHNKSNIPCESRSKQQKLKS